MADSFAGLNWTKILDRLARRVNPLMFERWFRGLCYYLVVDQAEYATDVLFISKQALAGLFAKLVEYAWPGNVRELRNVLQRATTLGRRGSEPAPFDRAVLERMNETLVHRGPDSGGVHVSPGAGLGARRLSIIDLAGGDQPIANEDETVWVVQNGEIYNFPELRDDVQAAGHRLRRGTLL